MVKFVVKFVVNFLVKLKNCRIGTKIVVVKYLKKLKKTLSRQILEQGASAPRSSSNPCFHKYITVPYGRLLLAPAESWWPSATWRALWIAVNKIGPPFFL